MVRGSDARTNAKFAADTGDPRELNVERPMSVSHWRIVAVMVSFLFVTVRGRRMASPPMAFGLLVAAAALLMPGSLGKELGVKC